MANMLEVILHQSVERQDSIWKTLSELLEDDGSLHRLRAASRNLRYVVDIQLGRLFRQLYVRAPLADVDNLQGLEIIAPLCHNLTIKVGYPISKACTPKTAGLLMKLNYWFPQANLERKSTLWRRRKEGNSTDGLTTIRTGPPPIKTSFINTSKTQPSTPSSRLHVIERWQQAEAKRIWIQLLSHFRQLRSLTLRVNGDRGWPGRTPIEEMLVILRTAIESSQLPELRKFSLAPIHAMGIIHLRWHSFGIFDSAMASGADMWTHISTLELHIRNPFTTKTLTGAQELMFRKILYEYLRGFAPKARSLRLIWLDGHGPNPLALHWEPGLSGRSAIKWPMLEELWVGHVHLPNRLMQLAREHASLKTRIKILRCTQRDSMMNADDSNSWVELLSPSTSDVPSVFSETASSVYSDGDWKPISHWVPGISRSSQDVTIMLRR